MDEREWITVSGILRWIRNSTGGKGFFLPSPPAGAEYLEGRSFRVAALWAATTGYFHWSGKATDPLIYGESQLQLALSEIYRVVPY